MAIEASLGGISTMLNGGARFEATGDPSFRDRSRSISAIASLFAPLDHLFGGSGLNEYGCQLAPCPDTPSFASNTATSISARAYARVSRARDELMQSAIAIGVQAAFDARVEWLAAHLDDQNSTET